MDPVFIGRKEELDALNLAMANSEAGKGETVIVSGEPGIGKTALVQEFVNNVSSGDFTLLSGLATSSSVRPFMLFADALDAQFLLQEQENISFTTIFAIDESGMLLAQSSSLTEDELDADIFAGMLSAVQSFVRDSFDDSGQQETGLGRLEYGDMKILIEHGQHFFLTGIFKGVEHPEMQSTLKSALVSIEKDHEDIFKNWTGVVSQMAPVQADIDRLAGRKYLVRKDLEGLKLENERLRIADEILSQLQEMAEEKPVLLYLGDLHWADESSLFVMNYLARNITEERICIVSTMRPAETEELAQFLERVWAEENVSVIELASFGDEDIGELVKTSYPENDFPEDFLNRLARQCNGNPFFVTEVLKQMEGDGNIILEYGKFTLASDEILIPETVEEAVLKRLDNLETDALALAEYASCIGQTFSRNTAMSHPSVRDSESAVSELSISGILTASNGELEFSHPILLEVIYGSINNRWRTIYHQSIGGYFETAYSDSPDEVVFELARHFSLSNEYQKGFDYSVRAAEKAESQYALDGAVGFYSTAVNLLDKLPGSSEQAGQKPDIVERMGDLYYILGEYEESEKSFDHLRHSSEHDETRARMLRKLCDIHEKSGKYDKAIECIDEAKSILGDKKSNEYGRLFLAGGFVHFGQGKYDLAMSHFEDALEIFEKYGGEKKDYANVMRLIGNVHLRKADFEYALKFYKSSLAFSEELEDLGGMSRTLNNIGITFGIQGNPSEAMEYYHKTWEICEKMGDKLTSGAVLLNLGVEAYNKGNPDECLAYFKKSLAILIKLGKLSNIGVLQTNMGILFMDKGDLDEALTYFHKSLATLEKIGHKSYLTNPLTSLGDAYVALNNHTKALEYYNRSLQVSLECEQKDQTLKCYDSLAKLYMEMDDLVQAEENAEKSLEMSNQMGLPKEISGSETTLGMVYREKGEYGEARLHFEKSLEIIADIESSKQRATTLYELGILLMAEGEKPEAIKSMKEAREIFHDIGVTSMVEKIDKRIT